MKIGLDRLTESELIDLNHRVVARLRMLAELRAHSSVLAFKVGERVSFEAEDGPSDYRDARALQQEDGKPRYRRRTPLERVAGSAEARGDNR